MIPEHFFQDKGRRNSTLLSMVEVALMGGLIVPYAIRLSLSDALLGGVWMLIFICTGAFLLALNAEIWFNLTTIEHIFTWSLPVLFGYFALLGTVHGFTGFPALVLVILILIAVDVETVIVSLWVRRWTNFVDDHPYLRGTFMEARPRLVKGFMWSVTGLLIGVTVLIALVEAFF